MRASNGIADGQPENPMNAVLVVVLLSLMRPSAPQTFSPDAEGFIRNWLVLAPIAIEGESGADEIDKEMLAGEATITPKAGDKATARGKEMVWTAHHTDDYFIDFLKAFGKERGEYVAGYAVTYITAATEMHVTLALSSNDQGKAWLNGKPVFRFADTRTLEKDSDRADVTLVKGQNVLVLKVINEVNNWQGCARFLKNGAPVTDIAISVVPSGK
jgi:hypothetical protein